ncbi:hypothetical protein CVIRNUC_006166 [Coccomyxa viridis]|uniref:DNA-binding protein n=1 Tax=Coccomyxa viridis TaxID=1274662 RepID=A0AAV1I6I9_9CHLO|nr:hypothetical protein CVIRNUC_006166 [Coccomyxa viridis]
MPKQQDPSETIEEFKGCVNMDVKELQKWLKTKESNEVGWAPDGGESTGHESGRIISELLQKDDDEFDDDDLKHMRKVISYVHRHQAQGPSKDVEHSKWRYSLMNWGNDPMKA